MHDADGGVGLVADYGRLNCRDLDKILRIGGVAGFHDPLTLRLHLGAGALASCGAPTDKPVFTDCLARPDHEPDHLRVTAQSGFIQQLLQLGRREHIHRFLGHAEVFLESVAAIFGVGTGLRFPFRGRSSQCFRLLCHERLRVFHAQIGDLLRLLLRQVQILCQRLQVTGQCGIQNRALGRGEILVLLGGLGCRLDVVLRALLARFVAGLAGFRGFAFLTLLLS